MSRKTLFAVVAVCALAPIAPAETPLIDFDAFVGKALKAWEVPGVAIAIVKDDAVVLAKGYGVRKLGESVPVDAKTRFAIGSVTKSFTAAALAMFVDQGKLKWDDPASKYLPGLQLFDPYATRELTVRDLLCHRIGLERGDLLWYANGQLSRDEIVRRLRYLKPSWSFRSRYGYQNIAFLAAGLIVERLAGESWDDFVAQHFFKPLGMTDAVTSIKPLAGADNVATPHDLIDGKLATIPWHNLDNMGPAGSINANVTGMAQYIRFQLGSEKVAGRRLVSQAALDEMHAPQTIIRRDGVSEKLYPDAHFSTYGLGWHLFDYRGRKVIEHGGSIDGMIAMAAFVPEEKLGLVVLCNREGTRLPYPILYTVLDAYFGAPPRDRIAEFLKIKEGIDKLDKERKEKEAKERVAGTKPSLLLEKYAGKYTDDFYGDVIVSCEKGKLTARYGQLASDLEHWNYETFRVAPKAKYVEPFYWTFHLGRDGKPESAKMESQGGDATFTYKDEGPPAIRLSDDDLKKFVGKYACDAPPLDLSVEFVAGKLKAVIAGQSAVELVPIAPARFKITGAPGSFVSFESAENHVQKALLETKSGNLSFQPKK